MLNVIALLSTSMSNQILRMFKLINFYFTPEFVKCCWLLEYFTSASNLFCSKNHQAASEWWNGLSLWFQTSELWDTVVPIFLLLILLIGISVFLLSLFMAHFSVWCPAPASLLTCSMTSCRLWWGAGSFAALWRMLTHSHWLFLQKDRIIAAIKWDKVSLKAAGSFSIRSHDIISERQRL